MLKKVVISILIILAELLNVIPHINDIDGKPEKKSVITYAVVGIVFMFIFTLCSGMSSMKFGDIYEYGNLSLEHYAITRDNYVEYKIDDTIKLSVNDQKNLVLSNLNTNYSFEIECESLYDYIIADLNDYYVLAYIDYENSSNAFLNYVYISKSENLNNNQYLNTLKNNIKKYLLPTRAELVVLDDYDNDKSYLTAYHIDYGYYVQEENYPGVLYTPDTEPLTYTLGEEAEINYEVATADQLLADYEGYKYKAVKIAKSAIVSDKEGNPAVAAGEEFLTLYYDGNLPGEAVLYGYYGPHPYGENRGTVFNVVEAEIEYTTLENANIISEYSADDYSEVQYVMVGEEKLRISYSGDNELPKVATTLKGYKASELYYEYDW